MSERTADEITLMGGPYPIMQTQPGEFHLSGGVTFWGVKDGVWVRRWEKRTDGFYFAAVFGAPIDWASWDSITSEMARQRLAIERSDSKGCGRSGCSQCDL